MNRITLNNGLDNVFAAVGFSFLQLRLTPPHQYHPSHADNLHYLTTRSLTKVVRVTYYNHSNESADQR